MAWPCVAKTPQEALWQRRPKDGLSRRENQFESPIEAGKVGEDGIKQEISGGVERRLLPYLEASGWEEKHDLEESGLAESRRVLAEEYWEAGQAFVMICFGVVFVVLTLDHIFYIEPIVYGLMVNIAGAAAIFFSGVRDPAMISAVVDADIREAKRGLKARKMAYHNSGFGLLFVGFSTIDGGCNIPRYTNHSVEYFC